MAFVRACLLDCISSPASGFSRRKVEVATRWPGPEPKLELKRVERPVAGNLKKLLLIRVTIFAVGLSSGAGANGIDVAPCLSHAKPQTGASF
jgi:hypothetical protein